MEEFLGRSKAPQLINVRPQVVVRDDSGVLATVSMHGSTWMTRDVPGRTALSVESRIELYIREELNHDWYERITRGAVLSLYSPGAAHSIRLFWDPDWKLRFWYVNLEDPYVRTDRGIQVSDNTLDVVITPDFQWSWKDEPEFEALVAAGKIASEKAQAIRAEGQRAIEHIEKRAWPYNEPWPEWRPDPSWVVPKISDYWTPP